MRKNKGYRKKDREYWNFKTLEDRWGRNVAKKAKDKIGKYFKGKTYEEIAKTDKGRMRRNKQNKWRVGKTHEQIMGKAKAILFVKRMSGSNNPSYRGGITKTILRGFRSKNWKKISQSIIKRDKNSCCECGKKVKGQKAVVHHKIPVILTFIKNKFNIKKTLKQINKKSELETLCRSCHMKKERKFDIIIQKFYRQYRAKSSKKGSKCVETIHPMLIPLLVNI